jgi:hypothetical protein
MIILQSHITGNPVQPHFSFSGQHHSLPEYPEGI